MKEKLILPLPDSICRIKSGDVVCGEEFGGARVGAVDKSLEIIPKEKRIELGSP